MDTMDAAAALCELSPRRACAAHIAFPRTTKDLDRRPNAMFATNGRDPIANNWAASFQCRRA